MEKPISARSSIVRSLSSTIVEFVATDRVPEFMKKLEKYLKINEVPATNQREVTLLLVGDFLTKGGLDEAQEKRLLGIKRAWSKKIRPKRNSSTPPTKAAPEEKPQKGENQHSEIAVSHKSSPKEEESLEYEAFLDGSNLEGLNIDGDIDLSDTPTPKEETPLIRRMREELQTLLKESITKKQICARCKDITVDGQQYKILSTWKVQGEKFRWNFSGAHSGTVITKCGPDVLVYENGRPLTYREDVEIEMNYDLKKSDIGGIHEKVSGSLFIWLLRHSPGQRLRCWLNEMNLSTKVSKDVIPSRWITL